MSKLIGLVAVYIMLKAMQGINYTADKVKRGSGATVNYLQEQQSRVTILVERSSGALEEQILMLKEENKKS